MLDPVQFASCFMEWVEAVNVMEGQVVAMYPPFTRQTASNSAVHM